MRALLQVETMDGGKVLERGKELRRKPNVKDATAHEPALTTGIGAYYQGTATA